MHLWTEHLQQNVALEWRTAIDVHGSTSNWLALYMWFCTEQLPMVVGRTSYVVLESIRRFISQHAKNPKLWRYCDRDAVSAWSELRPSCRVCRDYCTWKKNVLLHYIIAAAVILLLKSHTLVVQRCTWLQMFTNFVLFCWCCFSTGQGAIHKSKDSSSRKKWRC